MSDSLRVAVGQRGLFIHPDKRALKRPGTVAAVSNNDLVFDGDDGLCYVHFDDGSAAWTYSSYDDIPEETKNETEPFRCIVYLNPDNNIPYEKRPRSVNGPFRTWDWADTFAHTMMQSCPIATGYTIERHVSGQNWIVCEERPNDDALDI